MSSITGNSQKGGGGGGDLVFKRVHTFKISTHQQLEISNFLKISEQQIFKLFCPFELSLQI
jgi:hypothetical protein